MSYCEFSQYYDILMRDVDYPAFVDYYEKVFDRFSLSPGIVLDAACGTGTLSLELSKRGYDVIGTDASIEMLMLAREKAAEQACNCLFLNQRLSELDLYGTIDAVVCSLDSINHITDEKELIESFKKISLFLHPDGIFIFDVNSLYKHRKILGDNCFVLEEETVFCVWQNSLLEDDATVEINLDFFVREDDGVYVRTGESFCEKAYSDSELKKMLDIAGLKVEGVYDGLSFDAPNDETERLFYIVRKK